MLPKTGKDESLEMKTRELLWTKVITLKSSVGIDLCPINQYLGTQTLSGMTFFLQPQTLGNLVPTRQNIGVTIMIQPRAMFSCG